MKLAGSIALIQSFASILEGSVFHCDEWERTWLATVEALTGVSNAEVFEVFETEIGLYADVYTAEGLGNAFCSQQSIRNLPRDIFISQ